MAKRKTRKAKRSKKKKKTRRQLRLRLLRGGNCSQPTNTYQYSGEYDCDYPVCDANGDKISVQTVGMYEDEDTRIPEGRYIFAIRASDPNEIYYLSQLEVYDCQTGDDLEVIHTCLTEGEDVLAAGEIIVENDTYTINNWSGHYEPDADSLYYVKCLMEDLGYPNVSMRIFNSNSGTTRTMNNEENDEGNDYEYVFGSKWQPNQGEGENW